MTKVFDLRIFAERLSDSGAFSQRQRDALASAIEGALRSPLKEGEASQERLMQSFDRFERNIVFNIGCTAIVAVIFFAMLSRAIH